MTDFPRGWTISGVGTSFAVPATTGVVHVLDSFEVLVYWNGAAAAVANVQLTSSDGVFNADVIGFIAAAANSPASDSGSGLDLAAGPGASLTVSLSAVFTNNFMRLQGHDI